MGKTTKVLFSLRQIRPGASGGIAPYAKNLAEQLALNPDIELHLVETFFNHKSYCNIPEGKVTRHLLGNPGRYDQDLIDLITTLEPDSVFYPVAGDPIPEVGDEKYFICIADLQHLTYPNFFTPGDIWARNVAFGLVAEKSSAIITLSGHAKSEISNALQVDQDRVAVISPALDSQFQPYEGKEELALLEEKYQLTAPFMYYPANFWAHKNHSTLFDAMKLVVAKNPDMKLVLTGDLYQERPDLREQIEQLGLEDSIINLGYVGLNYVKALMSNATLVVFPSLFEGFGIPVLEALKCSRIVCCSNTTSLPEVGGDAAFYFDPEQPESIAGAIQEALTAERSTEREQATLAQAEKFSYEKSAMNLAAVLAGEKVPTEMTTADAAKAGSGVYPLVTVVTPSYNQGQFIEATIQSVLTQSYPNIELIVKDGGSTDNTVEILEKYKSDLTYTSAPDGGQTEAINTGLSESTGEYCCYLNSDDTFEPDAINRMVDYLQRNTNVDVMYGKADYIDKEGGFLSPYETFPWDFERFKGHCFICQPATMWRRATIEKFGDFDASLNYVMDYEYWIRIAAQGGTIGYCQDKLANSRLYDENKTMSGREFIFQEIGLITKRHLGATSPLWTYQHSRYLIEEKYNIASIFGAKRKVAVARVMAKVMTAVRDLPQTSSFYYAHFLKPRLANMGLFGRRAVAKVEAVAVEAAKSEESEVRKVTGLYSDGWVSNDLQVDLGKSVLMTKVTFSGSSPCEQELRVNMDGQTQTFDLDAGLFDLSIPVPASHVQQLSLSSSSPMDEGTGRKLVFHLMHTNLFNDLDVVF